MDASENLRGYAGDPNHSMHPDPYTNSIITPDSYTFLTGAMESPLKDQPGGSLLQQAPPVQAHEDGVEPQSSTTSGNLIGTLFTNHLTGSFNNASRSPPVPNSSNSWELTINGGSAGSLYAGGSNVNMPNILINGSGMMAGANNSTTTAQLLIGGLQGGSFNDNNDHGGVYYPTSQGHVNPHAEAMQLIYVNGGYGHNAFHPGHGRGGANAATLVYSSLGQDEADQNNNNNSTQQSSYGVSFLTPGVMSQRALEAAGGIPLVTLAQDRHDNNNNQSFSNNWQRNGGNEHSFLPVNEESSQSHQSLFGAALAGRHGVDQSHDLSHMHGGEHLQSEVGMHVENQSQGGNSSNNISVNGQGLLSLSLSSHQPHFQAGQLPGESSSEAHMVAQAAALAKTKELASRYIASTTGANADLSRFRTPSRDDVMGTSSRFHQENHHITGNSAHRKLAAGSSGSCNALTASQFLQSVQTILNELCKVTPLKRTSKPASSTEQQYPLRSTSASVNLGYGYHGKEDAHSGMHAEASTGRGDPTSSVGPLNDASHLVTVSHIPLQAEMISDAARASGASRDDLEFKKGQLIRMLDEVEARFRRYSDQLQVTCAGFNLQAGPNAATPYTILALQAMSRHFRCLKDAVKNQLKVVRRALGEEEVSAGINGETSRLRYVDQQIRQQRALQQLGMLQQHAWRPQRGLPERAVSVLRAWLFEHFLHPYPKDVDKMSLAKQTGLTRSQVSNWFINARVRLWKPMVEEMYVEEQREAADLVMQGERMVREQENMHNSPYDHYEGNNRGRSNSTLQDELHANSNGQPGSSLPNDYRSTNTVDEGSGRDQDQVGPSVNHNITEVQQAQALYRQQDMSAATGEQLNFSNYENVREAKRSKTALETVSDAFNNTTSILTMHPEQGENNAAAKLANGAGGSSEGDTNLEARKQKGKAVAAEHEQEVVFASSGAFVSYHDGNNLNHVHRYETVAGYITTSRAAAPTASTGVSLTLGLRHCDANMRSVAPILGKYDMDVDIARMEPLDREEYLNAGRFRAVNDNNGQTYEMQRNQQEENNHNGHLTREILPGGTGMGNSTFEHHHHEFNDAC